MSLTVVRGPRNALVNNIPAEFTKMKKRVVKRLVRKAILFVIVVIILSVVTTLIVEKRISTQKKTEEELVATDFNGDPVTPPFSRLYQIKTPRKPRPPVRQRHFEREPEPQENDIDQGIWPQDEGAKFRLPIPVGERKDWHDYAAMQADKQRVGFGEQGQPSFITDDSLKEMERNVSFQNGFNAMLSDMISVNRSVPDVRNEGCRTKKYLAKLPTASVVIPCRNEYFSVLLRTLHSIVNRTPPELLEEIIIVDDNSEREHLRKQLDDYIEGHFNNTVHVIRLPERMGLIAARIAGARKAKGDALVFFDSHIECGYNWLPPLLEPIAINPKISTCPIVDVIDHATFAYGGGYQQGSRGAFDWNLSYKQMPLLPEDALDNTKPSRNPVMMGGLFAIGREFFWELGGYDEGLDIWGAEQFELSFKIWMCGGMLLDVPCSRVAHIFRGPWESQKSPRNYNYVMKNNKRVAEVWMDEYKKYVYDGDPNAFENIDAGDLTKQHAIRERLKCKSFKWYLEVVAPDLLKVYPPVPPPDYASGAIQSVAYPKLCLDSMGRGKNDVVGMFSCAENRIHPQAHQFWVLSWHRELHGYRNDNCLDVQDTHPNATVWMWSCHQQGGNQFWYYDRERKLLKHGRHGNKCMEVFADGENFKVYTNECDPENERMQWIFGYVNNTALDAFYNDLV